MSNIFTLSGVEFLDIVSYKDLCINEGKTTFLKGESGCGKSTLFKLLNATNSLSNGRILFNDKDIKDINTIELRRKVQLVSQDVYLFEGTILENFKKYYEYRDMPLIDEQVIKKYLKLCQADFPLDAECGKMSGGERQRVFISICISFKPEVLMLDEPTSALDEHTANQLLTQIKEHCMKNHITLLVICHDSKLIETFADEIIQLDRGV